MSKLSSQSVFGGFSQSWDGFKITELESYELVSLTVADGQQKAFAKHFKKQFKATLPAPKQILPAEGGSAMWLRPNQYLVMLGETNINADLDIAAAFKDTGYSVLQSDSWAVLSVSGSRMHEVLERFIPLDLRGEPEDFAARTSAHHISVIAAKLLNGEILLLTPRSSAQSFLHALIDTVENL